MCIKQLENLDSTLLGTDYFTDIRRCSQLDIALNRFYDSYYTFAGANYNLYKANKKDLDINEFECDNDKIIRTFIRGEYLKSAMQQYRIIEDYMMHAITFSFELKPLITSKKDYAIKSEKLYYKKVIAEITRKKNKDLNSLLKIVEDFHNNEYIKKIRRQVNNLKHNNNLWFKEIYIQRPFHIEKYKKNFIFSNNSREAFKQFRKYMNGSDKKKVFDSSWVEPKQISLEEYIEICYGANKVIREYVHNIYNCIVDRYPNYNLKKAK